MIRPGNIGFSHWWVNYHDLNGCLQWVDTVEKVRLRLNTRKLDASLEIQPDKNQRPGISQWCPVASKMPITTGSPTFSTVSVERGEGLANKALAKLSGSLAALETSQGDRPERRSHSMSG